MLSRVIAQTGLPAAWMTAARGAGFPRAVLYRVGGGADYHAGGASGLRMARVQIDCYGETQEQAKTASRAVVAALSGATFGDVESVFLDSERDMPPDAELGEYAFRVSLDFMVHYQE